MTEAFKGSKSILRLGDDASPPVYANVFEVVSFGEFGQESELLEATHWASDAKEYIGGLPDGIEVTIVVNYKPTDTTHVALIAAQTAGVAVPFQLVLPPVAGSLTFSFHALVRGWRLTTITANEIVQASFITKISGAITGPA